MWPPFSPSIVRLRVLPDDPAAVVGPRPQGSPGKPSRRPHTDAKVAAVRRLIEQTALTYDEIAKRTGVGRASICRWTRDGHWQRPLFAPRATDTVPSARASAKLKRRTLAARLSALAERAIRELEQSASVDIDRLSDALELLKMAKLAARPRGRRRLSSPKRLDAPTRAALLEDLRAAGVNVERAPPAAVADFIASHEPPRDEPGPRRRRSSHRSKRNREHAWLLERE